LVSVLTKVLEKEPENAAILLKEFSRKEHKARFVPERDTIEERIQVTQEYVLANDQKGLFDVSVIFFPYLNFHIISKYFTCILINRLCGVCVRNVIN